MEGCVPAPDSRHVLLPAHPHGTAPPDMTLVFLCQLAEVISLRSLTGAGGPGCKRVCASPGCCFADEHLTGSGWLLPNRGEGERAPKGSVHQRLTFDGWLGTCHL